MEHEEQADKLEREADRLEEHSEDVADRIEDTRRDWETKETDSSVPGAQPDPGEEEEGAAGDERDEEMEPGEA